MSFWSELKRRNVVKVGIAYAIVAWLLIQGADIIFPHLNLPSWAVTFLIVFLIIGFPLALLFAWAFEITPDGIKLTKEVPRAESITRLTGKKLNYVVIGLLILAVAYIIFDKVYIGRRAVETEVASTVAEQVPTVVEVKEAPKTIAVLPFVDISPEKDQEYFVDGLSEELLNTLTQIPDLSVIARTSSFAFKGTNKKVQEIANELGVENILEGSVRKVGNALRITAQLVRAVDGVHLWSKTYDRELKDIFAVQEDIATAVADELKVTFGIEGTRRQLGGTDNAKAYELYMTAQGQYQGGPDNLSHALESIDAAIALDPEFALAWALKSQIHNGLSTSTPDNKAAEQDAASQAAQKAIKLEPDLAAGYYSLGVTKTYRGDWIEAELAYRNALELTTDLSLEYKVIYPFHYECVANFERANELLAAQLRNDPLNHNNRAKYMSSFVYLGDMQRVREEYERGKALLGDEWFFGDMAMWIARICSRETVPFDEIVTYWCTDDDKCKDRIKSPEDLLAELRQTYTDDNKLDSQAFMGISEYAAYLDDLELAMDAMEKAIGLDRTNTGPIWTPLMREVRQLPRFKELVKKIGLVDYWNTFGWPDICRPLDNGDFECD